MGLCDELVKKSDEELLNYIATQGFAAAGSLAGSEQTRNRELAKAILDNRSTKITKNHNKIMICLTIVIAIFTIVIAALTTMLVYKEFFAQ